MRRRRQACGQKVLCVLLEEQIHLLCQSQKISEFSTGVTFLSPTGSHPHGSRQKLLGGYHLLLCLEISSCTFSTNKWCLCH